MIVSERMEWLFGRKLTPDEMLRKNQRALTKVNFNNFFFIKIFLIIIILFLYILLTRSAYK